MTTFEPFTYLRPTPARVEADTHKPEVHVAPPACELRAGRLSTVIALAGLLTYAGGMPWALWEYLPR